VSDAATSLAVLAAVVALFLAGRLPVEVVAIGAALTLYATGVITLPEALAGFGDPTVILIAALFVVSEGLDATGVTTWVGGNLLERTGPDRRRLLTLVMLLVAGATALINVNGSVAALLPMVLVLAVRRDIPPSKLLMPLAFAGSAGSLLLLTGSPVNVIVSDAAVDAGVGRFAFAEFALVGVPLVAGTVAIVLVLGDRLLPDRAGAAPERDLSALARTLVHEYELDHVVRLRLGPDSALLGRPRTVHELALGVGARVVTITDGASGRPVASGSFAVGDHLTVVGQPEAIERFAETARLTLGDVRGPTEVADALIHREGGVAEVILPPRSPFLGEPVHAGEVLGPGDLVVLAVRRAGHDLGSTPTVAAVGDVLLLEGSWGALETVLARADVLLVDAPDLVRRRAVPMGPRSARAVTVLAVMVVLLATGVVEPVVAALLGAGAMILSGALTVQQAYRRISWTTVLLVAGIIPLSTAIRTSGAGESIASVLIGAVGDAPPVVLLAALFALTATFGQLISNTATALIVIPIAVSAASQLGVSARPVLMCVLVASAAAFLTPVATPANMMVMGPAGYRFGDYWKLGLPLLGLFFLVGVGLVPLIWRF
jgi:di/tricarboxylate transporter